MTAGTCGTAVLLVSLALPGSRVLAGEKDICVRISDMYRGRNCGTADSVQVDVRSSCGMRVKGFVIFNQASGDPIRFGLTLDPGDRQVVFACNGNGTVGKDFDIDRDGTSSRKRAAPTAGSRMPRDP